MRMRLLIGTAAVAGALAVALSACQDITAPAPRGAPPRPSLSILVTSGPIDLGALPGGTASYATRVSNLGRAVGYGNDGAGSSAYVWTAASGMVALPALGGPGVQGLAYDINNGGLVVGASDAPLGGIHATAWTVRESNDACLIPCALSAARR